MNVGVFGSYLIPIWHNNTPTSISDAAEKIATAYHISNIGQSTTPYAAPLLNADKSILKTFLELGMSINFYGSQTQSTVSSILAIARGAVGGTSSNVISAERLVARQLASLISGLPIPLSFIGSTLTALIDNIFSKLKNNSKESGDLLRLFKQLEGVIQMADTNKLGFMTMSTGICLYWLSAKISPVPPMPPCIAPTIGSQILFPGLPVPLNSDMYDTFKYPQTPEEAIAKFYNSLILHQFTIVGLYGGIIPFFPSPIPGPPIPWISMLNIPFPNFKLPNILDKDGNGKKDPKTSTSGNHIGATGNIGTTSIGNPTGQLGSSGQSAVSTNTSTSNNVTSSGTSHSGTNQSGNTVSQSGNATGQTSGGQTGGHVSGRPGGSSSTSTTFGNNSSNSRYNPPTSISTFLLDETEKILSTMNPNNIVIDDDVTSAPYAQLVIEIRENTNMLNNGEREYQYSITIKLDNLSQNKQLNGAQLNLPTAISEKRVYTFRDVLEGNNSIFSQIISSPKLRAIELMKAPYRSALSFVIGDGLRNYVDKWYAGVLPEQLKRVRFYATTSIEDNGDRIGSTIFSPLQKFQSLK